MFQDVDEEGKVTKQDAVRNGEIAKEQNLAASWNLLDENDDSFEELQHSIAPVAEYQPSEKLDKLDQLLEQATDQNRAEIEVEAEAQPEQPSSSETTEEQKPFSQ